jgi:hypothetical protein
LTGLEIDGANAAYNGIVFNTGGSLTVSNCIVKDFVVNNNNNNGTSGNGILMQPTSGTLDFTIITGNSTGIQNDTSPNTFYTYGNNQINENNTDGYTSLSTSFTTH